MLSKWAYILCISLMCYASFCFYPRWQKPDTEAAIAFDVSGYYWYLPSIFIYHDLTEQKFHDSILAKYKPTPDFQQAFKHSDNGHYVFKYTAGMAVMYLPFFTIAHLAAGPLGYPKDGFSAPYQFAIQYGGLLVALIGLWYFRKLLLLYFSDKVTAITLLLLVFGSNYLNYAAIDTGMSHSWLFTLYVFLLLCTHHFYATEKKKYAAGVGLLIGLATLARPTEIISCLIPLLWGMENLSVATIKNRILFIGKHFGTYFLAGICAVAVMSIQVVYWKYVSGHWHVYSYQDQGFSWLKPHFYNYAVGIRTGWLRYSPMLILAFIGVITLIKNGSNRVALITFFILNFYVVSAWDVWWFGGRAMVQSYPVQFLLIASLLQTIAGRRILQIVFIPAILLFVYMNLWITYQYHGGGLYDPECMTRKYYLRVAGRWSAPESTLALRDDADLYEGVPKNLHLLYQNDFENDTGNHYAETPTEGKRSLQIDKENQNTSLKFQYTSLNADWVRAQAVFKCANKEWDTWRMAQFVIRLKNKDKVVKECMMRVYRSLNDGEKKTLTLDLRVPHAGADSIEILFWNADSDKPLIIDNVKVWSFNE